MGESKRRQSALGDKYGQEENILPWLPITKSQASQAYKLTTRGAWIGIGVLAGVWLVIRFVGPAFGWWNVQSQHLEGSLPLLRVISKPERSEGASFAPLQ